ncbi:MAG: mercury(II) reductase [Deltaproteobacteria bacterium]|nr:mercury(II) reductase [Deltaproteobacteria bacterium]
MDCCGTNNKDSYDLVIIGSGSAAFAGAIHAAELGKKVAMIERNTLGGTCVNVGCVPSKTLIRAAETIQRASHSRFRGVISKGVELDFATIIREKDRLVDTLREAKYQNVLRAHDSIEFIAGDASFLSDHEIKVGKRRIRGRYFLIATGASPYVPAIPGLQEVNYLTSTTAFELRQLPSSMAIIGGRYIALELAQLFQRMGSQVTILQRSERILPTEDPDISADLSRCLEDEGISIMTGVKLTRIEQGKEFTISYTMAGEDTQLSVEQLVVATGRRPNTVGLNLHKIDVELNHDGSIATDRYNQTSQPHIYGAGDVIGNPAFVYTAANEGKLAVANAFADSDDTTNNGPKTPRDYTTLPYVVFTDPQVAGVGLNETTAARQGIDVDVAKLSLDNVPRSLTARDTRGFIKLLREKGTNYLLGAAILAPEGGELLMEISLAIKYKIPITEIASMFHPYLTLGEGVKLAAQTFEKDVKQLSCCAS